MIGNNLSFSITVRNNASTALNALQKQVQSLKNGLSSVGSTSSATSNYLNSLQGGIGKVTRSFGGLGSSVKQAIGVFTGFKVVNGMFSLLTGGLDKAVSRIDTMDLFTRKMEMFTGDANKATWALGELKKATKGTPYALDTAAKSVQNFVLRGMTTEQATDSVKIWMDAVSTYGQGTTEQLDSVMDAIAKMRTKGTVEMRYLNRLFNAGINPVQMYAQATGMAASDVQEALSHKDIGATEFLDVVETAMREGTNGVIQVAGNAKEMATTWSATLANMKVAIARGRTELISGMDELAKLFNSKGLKGMVAGFGTGVEDVFTGVGHTVGKIGIVLGQAYNTVKSKNEQFFHDSYIQYMEFAKSTAGHFKTFGNTFKTSFSEAISPYLENAIIRFQDLKVSWANVADNFAAGLEKISKPLGEFFGTYLGESITSIEDLGKAFGDWLNLKLPDFFDKLQEVLQWLIDHKDGVVTTAKAIIKAMVGFSVLQSVQGILIGFNDKLKMINDTLAFFTRGKVQLPTLENLAPGNEKTLSKIKNIGKQHEEITTGRKGIVNLPPVVPSTNPYNLKKKNKVGKISDLSNYPSLKIPNKSALEDAKMLPTGYPFPSTVGAKVKENKSLTRAQEVLAKNFTKINPNRDLSSKEIAASKAAVNQPNKYGFLPMRESIGKSLEGINNLVKKGKDGFVNFFKGAKGGYEKNLGVSTKDLIEDYKAVGKGIGSKAVGATKTIGSKAVGATKTTGSNIANFFGTMGKGFVGLGKGQSATTALNVGAEAAEIGVAAEKTGLLTKVIEKLKGGFTAAAEGVKTFVDFLTGGVLTTAGMVTAVIGATAAIAALAAGLGVFNPGNKVSDAINQFFTSFSEWCSTFAENAPILIQSFVTGLIQNLPQLVSQGVNLLLSIVNGILVGLPKMLTVGVSVILSLVSGLAQVLPELVYQGFNAIGQFIAGIIQNLPNILSAAWELIKTLAIGLLRNAPVIIASGIKLIINLITGIGSMLSQVGTAIKDLIINSVTYVWEHPQEIWDSITGLCGELWNALLSGLYAAADMFNAGWILDSLGAQRPEVEQGGVDTAQAAVDGANKELQNSASALDFGSMWDSANVDAAKAQAGVDGQQIASGLTDAIDTELAQETLDAGQMGTDTASNYVDGVSSGIEAGNESVNGAISGLGQEGLANLTVNFNSEQIAAAAGNLITNLNNAINANAPTLYMTMAVVAQNCITQLSAGFAVGDEVPSGIAEAMTSVVAKVATDVRMMTEDIKAKLNEAKVNSEQTTAELTAAIKDNFATAKISVSDNLVEMKTTLLTQYDQLREGIYNDLSSISGYHTTYSTEGTDYLLNEVTTKLQQTKNKYSEFDTKVREILNGLKDYHKQVAVDAMQGMIDGLESKRPAVASKEAEIVLLLKTTFEDGLGIHSPSRWGEWVGQMIVLGMVQGLSEGGKLSSFVSAIIDDMRNSFKNGKFNADELVDYMGQDGTMKVVKYLEYIGDQTVADAINGDGGTPAIITEALKYVGYAPGGGNSMFGLHYGNPGAWCASFVRYCAEKVGVPFPATNFVPDVLAWSIANGRYTQTPQPGYAAIFGGGSHIELVAGVSPDGTVDYVGGNTGMGEVKHRPRSDATSFVALDGGHSTFTLKDTIMRAYNKKFNPAALLGGATGAAYNPSAGVAQWRDIVLQALAMLGQPASLVDDVLYAIERESSGNPNSINLTDSNAAAGHPSQGLLQTIPETFAAYRNPNLPNNITDPLANIYAALNYMIQRYGGIANVVQPRRASANGWYGYSVGTRYVPGDMLAMIHKNEAILPASQNPYSQSGGNYLYDLFSNVMSNDNGELSGLGFDVNSLQGNTNNTNNSNINFSNNFEIHNSNNVDADRNISNMEAMFIQMIRDGRAQGVPR